MILIPPTHPSLSPSTLKPANYAYLTPIPPLDHGGPSRRPYGGPAHDYWFSRTDWGLSHLRPRSSRMLGPSSTIIDSPNDTTPTNRLHAAQWHRRAIVFNFYYFSLYFHLYLIVLIFMARVGPVIIVFHFILVNFILYLFNYLFYFIEW